MKKKLSTERTSGYGPSAESLLNDLDEMALHFAGAAVVLHFYEQYAFLVFHDEEHRRKKLTDLLCGAGLPTGFIACNHTAGNAMFMLVPLPEYANDEGRSFISRRFLKASFNAYPRLSQSARLGTTSSYSRSRNKRRSLAKSVVYSAFEL